MSAIGPKQTLPSALHMSAFGGKADMTIGTCPLSWSLSGVKQTSLVAAHMSAFDPKRTLVILKADPSRAMSQFATIRCLASGATMRRREFIGALGCVATWALMADAQQAER